MSHCRTLVVAALLAAALPLRLHAQSDPRLLAAVAEAQQGQGDSARAAVTALLNATSTSDPLYAEALYTLGRIAANAGDMQKAMLRVAVEFGGSPWADNALLQLAQLSYANGDLPGTERNLERLRGDYPNSDVLGPASLWAARAYFAQGNIVAGCGWLQGGIGAAGNNVELANQLQFLDGRCQSVDSAAQHPDTSNPPAAAPGATTPVTPTPTPAPSSPAATTYAVQVAAFKTEAQAGTVKGMLTQDGFPPHVVKDADGSFKVRVGNFPTKAAATALAAKLRVKYGDVFVVEERP